MVLVEGLWQGKTNFKPKEHWRFLLGRGNITKKDVKLHCIISLLLLFSSVGLLLFLIFFSLPIYVTFILFYVFSMTEVSNLSIFLIRCHIGIDKKGKIFFLIFLIVNITLLMFCIAINFLIFLAFWGGNSAKGKKAKCVKIADYRRKKGSHSEIN